MPVTNTKIVQVFGIMSHHMHKDSKVDFQVEQIRMKTR